MPATVGTTKKASRIIGAMVQPISSALLPCTCFGSGSPFLWRNLTQDETRPTSTRMKMASGGPHVEEEQVLLVLRDLAGGREDVLGA